MLSTGRANKAYRDTFLSSQKLPNYPLLKGPFSRTTSNSCSRSTTRPKCDDHRSHWCWERPRLWATRSSKMHAQSVLKRRLPKRLKPKGNGVESERMRHWRQTQQSQSEEKSCQRCPRYRHRESLWRACTRELSQSLHPIICMLNWALCK
jgi:hypothetical protein